MSDGGMAAHAIVGLGDNDTAREHWATTFNQSCPLCHGTRIMLDKYPCSSCEEPDFARVRWMLPVLSGAQIRFLRAFEHTRANQCVTKEEYDNICRIEYFVEGDDAVYDDATYDILVPATRYWFASGELNNSAPGGEWHYFIRYNPAGLHLRRCLMAGANARQTHA